MPMEDVVQHIYEDTLNHFRGQKSRLIAELKETLLQAKIFREHYTNNRDIEKVYLELMLGFYAGKAAYYHLVGNSILKIQI